MRGKLIFVPPTFLGHKFQKTSGIAYSKNLDQKKIENTFPFPNYLQVLDLEHKTQ